jgi:hypothetical protein
MEVAQPELETHADILAKDVDGKVVLLVKVQADKAEYKSVQKLLYTWQAVNSLIPFAMFVDLEKTWIYKRHHKSFTQEPIETFKTGDILKLYDEKFDKKQILKPYLITLVEAWLGDLSYNWKWENPPASNQLDEIGLLQKIKSGTTQCEVELKPLIRQFIPEDILNKIQKEIESLVYEAYGSNSGKIPDSLQQKIKETSDKILTLLQETDP